MAFSITCNCGHFSDSVGIHFTISRTCSTRTNVSMTAPRAEVARRELESRDALMIARHGMVNQLLGCSHGKQTISGGQLHGPGSGGGS